MQYKLSYLEAIKKLKAFKKECRKALKKKPYSLNLK